MQHVLTSLSEKDLQKKLNEHYMKINKYRGPHIIPTFDDIHFIDTKDGKKFLVGAIHGFDSDYVCRKDEAYNEEGSTPHVSSNSLTFAVMIENNCLSDVAFEINAYAYETYIADYTPSMRTNCVKINGRLKSQFPAMTYISIIHHQGSEHFSCGIEGYGFHNIADRRKILDVLNTRAKKNKPYEFFEMSPPSHPAEWSSVVQAPNKMIDICADLIYPTKQDIEAAQDYRHHVNTQKISAQRQAINEIGGSTSKSRFYLTKMWLNFRSNWLARK